MNGTVTSGMPSLPANESGVLAREGGASRERGAQLPSAWVGPEDPPRPRGMRSFRAGATHSPALTGPAAPGMQRPGPPGPAESAALGAGPPMRFGSELGMWG